jgi:hypothetical protein
MSGRVKAPPPKSITEESPSEGSPSPKDAEKAKGKDEAKAAEQAQDEAKAAEQKKADQTGPKSPRTQAFRVGDRPASPDGGDPGESQFHPERHGPTPEKLPPQFGKQTGHAGLQFADPRHPHAGGPPRPGPEGRPLPQGPRPGGPPLPDRPLLQLGPRQRPLPPEPRPEAYRALLKEPVFQGPFKGAPLFQKMQAQAMREAMMARMAAGSPQRQAEQVLTRGEVIQLFRQRHQAEKREEFRAILRYELAKARAEQRQKVQALHARNEFQSEGGDAPEAAQRLKMVLTDTALRNQFARKLRGQSSDSPFEQILQRVLDGKQVVPDLPEGVRARFAAKTESEWRAFFTQVMGMNSQAVETQLKLTQLIEALFRGVFREAEGGRLQIVSDITVSEDGETVENKFARLTIDNPEMASRLQTLVPGDMIAQELLKLIGENAKFLKLEHVPQGVAAPTEQQKKEALAEMRATHSRDAQRKLEDALLASRHANEEDDDETRYPGPFPPPHHPLRDRPFGRPRGLMYLFYATGSALAMILIYLLIRGG